MRSLKHLWQKKKKKQEAYVKKTIIEFSHSRQQLFFLSSSIIFFRPPTTWRQIGSLNFSRDAYPLPYPRLHLLTQFQDRRSSVFLFRRIAKKRDRISSSFSIVRDYFRTLLYRCKMISVQILLEIIKSLHVRKYVNNLLPHPSFRNELDNKWSNE